jgi:hypothetical protein
MAARQFVAELADGLEERQALDVADRAADLDQHEIEAVVAVETNSLMASVTCGMTCTVRAEIIAAPLLGDDVLDRCGRW